MNRNDIVAVFDHAHKIDQASSLDDIVGRLRAGLSRFGFTACLVTVLPSRDHGQWHEHVLVNGWPLAWYERYLSAGHYRHDPCAARCRTTAVPFAWGEVARVAMDPRSRLVMDEACEFGLRHGICVPIHAPFAPSAAVTVAGERTEPVPAMLYTVQALAQHAYLAAMRLHDSQPRPTRPLSGREREILQWTAAGKTAWEISVILGIAEYTVATHLRNARKKLDTANIVHTVVEAFRTHEIQL